MYRFRRNNSDNKDKWSRGAKLLINKEKHKPKRYSIGRQTESLLTISLQFRVEAGILRLAPGPPELCVAVILFQEGSEVVSVQPGVHSEHCLHHLDVLDHVGGDLENITVGKHPLNLLLVIFPFTLAYVCHRESLIKL